MPIAVLFDPMNSLKKAVKTLAIVTFLVAVGSFQPSLALQVSGLYSERIAVANESDAERNRAFRDALAAVVLKVTGEQRWLEHPAVEQALDNAQSYVEAIAYSNEFIAAPQPALSEESDASIDSSLEEEVRNEEDESEEEANENLVSTTIEQRYVEVDFSARLINELLTDANIPVWDSNRPSVLLWMALQDADGNRTLLTSDINQEIIDAIQDFAAARGLPVIFPVLDFEDRRNLSEDLVWSLNEESIRRASERYDADSVLTGRLHFTASGELVGLWQFLFGPRVDVFDGFATDIDEYLYAPLDRVTGQLASYFAIVPEASASSTVRLTVEGVSDLQDYSALIAYVGNLGLVESVFPAAIDGEQLELELGLVGNAGQLYELIALDRDLLPIQSSQVGQEPVLHYRWTR